MRDPSSSDDSTYESNSYQEILPKYNLNHQFLLRHGFSKLKTDMGFTQIRFYCFKKKPGSVFHITTSKNIKGTAVVDFFTVSDTMPEACGSFTRFSDDNSTLASICDEWGHPSYNRWGHRSYRTDERLFKRPLFRKGTNSNNMNFIFSEYRGAFPIVVMTVTWRYLWVIHGRYLYDNMKNAGLSSRALAAFHLLQ